MIYSDTASNTHPLLNTSPIPSATRRLRRGVFAIVALLAAAFVVLAAPAQAQNLDVAPPNIQVTGNPVPGVALTWDDPGHNYIVVWVRWRKLDADPNTAGNQPGNFSNRISALKSQIDNRNIPIETNDLNFSTGDTLEVWALFFKTSAPDGNTGWFNANLGTPPSANSTLSGLTVKGSDTESGTFSALTLTPAFTASGNSYTVDVANQIEYLKLTPTKGHSGASIKVGKSGSTLTALSSGSDSEAISLDVGANAISVEVTAANGSTTLYVVNVTRAAQVPLNTATVTLSATREVVEGESVTVTVTLSVAQTVEVGIPITLTAGTAESGDYGSGPSATITIPANALEASIQITAEQDMDKENETFTVALGSLLSGLSAGSPSSVLVTILDNDNPPPSAIFLSASPRNIPEGGTSEITVRLDNPAPAGGTTISLSFLAEGSTAVEGLDYEVTTKTFTILQGRSSAKTTLTASVDEENEGDEIITVDVPTAGASSLRPPPTLIITIVEALQAEQLHHAVLPEMARAIAGHTTSAISARVGRVLDGGGGTASLGGQDTVAGALTTHAASIANGARDLRDLLSDTHFVLPLSGGANGVGVGDLGSVSLWASGDYRNLSGEDGDLDLDFEFDGDLHSASIGVDSMVRANLLAGVALSWSEGSLQYASGTDGASGQGDYEVDVIAFHPYLGGSSARLDWWATVGYGSGEVEITPTVVQAGAGHVASSNDVSMTTLGAGGSGVVWSQADSGARVHLKGEFTHTRMDVEESEQVDSLAVDATLARVALAASRTQVLSGGGQFSPSLSLGARHDGGDGNTGTGAEVTANLRYDNAESGVSTAISAHGLFGRSDYEEWGVQGMVRLSPGADGQGMSFEMSPGYGNHATGGGDGNTGQIWSNGLRGDHATPAIRDASGRLEMRLGYGLSSSGQRGGLLTPWGGLALESDGKRYRLGLNWQSAGPFTLRLHGERRESAEREADHAVLLKGALRF